MSKKKRPCKKVRSGHLRFVSQSKTAGRCPICPDFEECKMSNNAPAEWWFVRGMFKGFEEGKETFKSIEVGDIDGWKERILH